MNVRLAMPLMLLLCGGCGAPAEVHVPADADPARGARLIAAYGCGSCHRIPGIPGAHANVGPPLHALAHRAYIGGVVPNTFENLTLWLREPPAIDPPTAMPDLGVDERDAADMAAYLYAETRE